jgi:MacB-like periplasmic core domain
MPLLPRLVGFGQQNEMAVAEFATAGFFAVLGVNAVSGRVFTMDDGRAMSAPPVAVIGYGLWRRLGADPGIVGKTIAVNQGRYAVVGVAAEGFKGTTGILLADVWIPLEAARPYLSRITSPGQGGAPGRSVFDLLVQAARSSNGLPWGYFKVRPHLD